MKWLTLSAAAAYVAALSPVFAADLPPKGPAEHVVLVVWDGMRPDFITPQHCPTLYSLATNGVFFRRHHPVFISSTEVNGAALATGAYPGHNGILANTEYQPEVSVTSSYATEGIDAIRRGDMMTGGHYIMTPTVAEILHQNNIPTVIAGSKPVALFHDRSTKRTTPAQKQSVTLFEGKTIPRSAGEALPKVNDDKPFPPNITQPNSPQDNWTTRSLVKSLWKKEIPKYTLLWLSDPDKSQHEFGVGSPTALAGIESSDKNLAEVIKALKERGVYEKTDIMVVSDHGFSTIAYGPDLADILKKQKFSATKKMENPEPGDVMVVGVGGSVLLYVLDRDEGIIRRLVDFLQTADFTGVIFSRTKMEGTFPLESINYPVSNDAPDLLVSLRWSADRNTNGAPGMMTSMGGTPGKGSHASLSRFEMNNTLVAAGPNFKRGFIDDTPSGNVDVGPTILWLLGIKKPSSMDGRVLFEALSSNSKSAPKVSERKLEASREVGLFRWQQYLKVSEVEGTTYFDEGNGEVLHR